jgi:hypothetical protein
LTKRELEQEGAGARGSWSKRELEQEGAGARGSWSKSDERRATSNKEASNKEATSDNNSPHARAEQEHEARATGECTERGQQLKSISTARGGAHALKTL